MEELQKKIDAVMRLATANTIEERNAALEEAIRLLEAPSTPAPDAESIIRDILQELGAQDHLLGYSAVIEAVMIVLEDPRYVRNLTYGLYEKLAECFDTTASKIERAIRYLIERMWITGDPDCQYRLFGNTIDMDKAKPTNGQFISRIANITRQRLKMA